MTENAIDHSKSSKELPEVVILTGKKKSGKDTVADYLINHHGYVKYAFATHLKAALHRIDPILDFEHVNNQIIPVRVSDAFRKCSNNEDKVKEDYPEYRNFMQKFATDGIRHVKPDFWTCLLLDDVAEHKSRYGNKIVITDVRFDNEDVAATAISGNYVKWEVIRPSLVPDLYSSHSSENGLSDSIIKEYTPIINDGTLIDLYNKIDELLS